VAENGCTIACSYQKTKLGTTPCDTSPTHGSPRGAESSQGKKRNIEVRAREINGEKAQATKLVKNLGGEEKNLIPT